MDIITKGQRIFKIHSNIIENELTVGQVEFQDDKNESFGNQFDKLKEAEVQDAEEDLCGGKTFKKLKDEVKRGEK